MPAAMTLLATEPERLLEFPRQKNCAAISRRLTLTNCSDIAVAFKVKTTAPRSYLVRPATGMVQPQEFQDVEIVLNPGCGPPEGGGLAEAEEPRHRFLIQATPAGANGQPLSREAWAALSRSQLQERRLNVAFSSSSEGATMSTAAPNSGETTSPGELQAKFDELLLHSVALERRNKSLKLEIARLREQTRVKASSDEFDGYSLWHAVLAVLLAVLASSLLHGSQR